MKKKKGTNNFLFGLLLTIGAIASGILIATKTTIITDEDGIGRIMLLTLLAVVIMLFSLIIFTFVHELGHLVFGLLSGYKFVSFRITNHIFTKENGKLIKKRLEVPGGFYQCLLDPPEFKNDRIPTYLYNMGGVFFNLLLAIINVLLFFVLIKFNETIATIMLVLGLANYILVLSNGLPRKTILLYNDGYNAIHTSKNKEANKAFYYILKVNALISNNVSYENMPSSYFYMPDLNTMDNPIVSSIAYQYYEYLKGINKYDEALKFSKILLSSNNIDMAGTYRILLMAENIYNDCILNDYGNAAIKYNDHDYRIYSVGMVTIPSVLRAKYAYELLANDNTQQAIKTKTLFYNAYGKYPYKEEVKHEIALFEKIDEIYKVKKEEPKNTN